MLSYTFLNTFVFNQITINFSVHSKLEVVFRILQFWHVQSVFWSVLDEKTES